MQIAQVPFWYPKLPNSGSVLINLFGTHSLRRGGAQALATAGWALEDIKFFGRWASDAVELYLLEAPFAAKGHLIAAAMLQGATGMAPEKPKKIFGPLVPQKGSQLRIESRDESDISQGHYEVIVTDKKDNIVTVRGCGADSVQKQKVD